MEDHPIVSSWHGTKFLNYAKGKNKDILPDFFKKNLILKNIYIYFFILLFLISIGAEARTGGHIRQLIHGWNKNRLKQNKNETQSDLMLATLFQNDENITEEQQTTAAGGEREERPRTRPTGTQESQQGQGQASPSEVQGRTQGFFG